jgi:hypothetical protein
VSSPAVSAGIPAGFNNEALSMSMNLGLPELPEASVPSLSLVPKGHVENIEAGSHNYHHICVVLEPETFHQFFVAFYIIVSNVD